MKTRVLTLFDRLSGELSEENSRAIAIARSVVISSEVNTYDDYANVMQAARQVLHRHDQCLGNRVKSHGKMRGPVISEYLEAARHERAAK